MERHMRTCGTGGTSGGGRALPSEVEHAVRGQRRGAPPSRPPAPPRAVRRCPSFSLFSRKINYLYKRRASRRAGERAGG